jgi:hypothetical protein
MRLLPYLAWAYLEVGNDARAEEVVLEGILRYEGAKPQAGAGGAPEGAQHGPGQAAQMG